MTKKPTPRRFLKRTLALGVALVLSFVLAEAAVRVYFATKTGTRTLLYGTPWHRNVSATAPMGDSESHAAGVEERHTVNSTRNNVRTGYAKFFPNESRMTYDVDGGEVFTARINNHGFRGKDFTFERGSAAIRVVSLGASSTFGYYNSDADTYPSRLQEALNERCGERTFEVYNLGIPHLTSDEIAALFKEDALRYQPDVATLYAGNNDSLMLPSDEQDATGPPKGILAANVAHWSERIATRSLLVKYVLHRFASKGLPIVTGDWMERYAQERSDFFLKHVREIAEICRERGILLVVASQQKKSTTWWPASAEFRERMKSLTYADEVRDVERRAAHGQLEDRFQLSMLTHAHMMRDLRAWVAQNDVALADVIEALDHDRHLLLSNVHLHRDANRVVGATMAEAILANLGCPD